VGAQLDAPAALPRGKNPKYPLDTRLGEPQRLSRRYGELQFWVVSMVIVIATPLSQTYRSYFFLVFMKILL
jgi:hypothetical protein